jgi:hypothetical protein
MENYRKLPKDIGYIMAHHFPIRAAKKQLFELSQQELDI